MKVLLQPGDQLVVQLDDTDGEFKISYDFGGSGKLTVEADLPDSSDREGVIYEENFSESPDEKIVSKTI